MAKKRTDFRGEVRDVLPGMGSFTAAFRMLSRGYRSRLIRALTAADALEESRLGLERDREETREALRRHAKALESFDRAYREQVGEMSWNVEAVRETLARSQEARQESDRLAERRTELTRLDAQVREMQTDLSTAQQRGQVTLERLQEDLAENLGLSAALKDEQKKTRELQGGVLSTWQRMEQTLAETRTELETLETWTLARTARGLLVRTGPVLRLLPALSF